MIKVDYKKCTGCGACIQKCPKQCVSWENKELGHLYPIVDTEACLNCGLCDTVCPIDKTIKVHDFQAFYAAVHKDKSVLQTSTSGGAFSAISQCILDMNGVIYGVAIEDFKVSHIRVDSLEGLSQLKGSKYVQSNTKATYCEVEKDLKNGIIVLYSGTPCQIHGLKSFLGKEYENLYTVDIVCHGVGSQAYFDKHVDELKLRYPDLKSLSFRSKRYVGWSSSGGELKIGEKHKPYYEYNQYYYSYFLSSKIYRSSCYQCRYTNLDRIGDFTLGDFWGVEHLKLPFKTNTGCSLLICNSKKGFELLERIKEYADIFETNSDDAVRKNEQLKQPSQFPDDYKLICDEYERLNGSQITKKFVKSNKTRRVFGWIKSKVPHWVRALIRKIK